MTSGTFYDRLVADTAAERAALFSIPFIQEGVAGRLGRDSYLAFLPQAYYHVKHTVPLLMTCGGRLPERLEWLREAIGHYIAEESGHHEWILNDIRACGGDTAATCHGTPALATELMVAYAYDTVQRGNPAGFFGMVFALEGTSMQLATRAAASLKATLCLPDQAFTYLTSHGALDVDHVAFFQTLMNRLEQPADQAAVLHAAKRFYHLYGNIFRGLPMTPAHGVDTPA